MIYMGLPDEEQIKEIIKINLGQTGNPRHSKNAPKKVYTDLLPKIDEMSKTLNERSYSGRDIAHLVKGAKEEMAKRIADAIKRGVQGPDLENICMLAPEDIAAALVKITPAPYDEAYWTEMAQRFNLVGFKGHRDAA
jgi:SpoVK/Ycf46/Vps4 family AAA+-type ATPase